MTSEKEKLANVMDVCPLCIPLSIVSKPRLYIQAKKALLQL